MLRLLAECALVALFVGPASVPLVRASSHGPVASSGDPPPEVASYNITARYDPVERRILASEVGTYHNRTLEPIFDLVFHLYLNAFRSDDTLWLRESGPQHRGFNYDPNHPGWMEVEEIRLVDGTLLELEAVDDDATLVRAALPEPVAPGQLVTVQMAFTAQLPRVFARTGWADGGDFVMAGQWFPKFGVWENGAWNAYLFHANSEFYADFGSYEVAVTLPTGWQVGATGTLQGKPVENLDGTVTHHFLADHVVDFAWGASPHFRTQERIVDGRRIAVLHYAHQRGVADRVMEATVGAFELYERWYGPYGGGLYPGLTVILVPENAGGAGGMEYPTLFTVGALGLAGLPPCVRFVEAETVHELGHQWFQSVIATNEAEAPWLDEGFTEYSTARAMRELQPGGVVTCGGWTMSYLYVDRLVYRMTPETPMAGKAWELGAYDVAAYAKPALALSTLERRVGEGAMLDFLRLYTERYAFAHPGAEDVRVVMAESLGQDIADWFFDAFVSSDATLDARVVELTPSTVEFAHEGALCVPVSVVLARDGGRDVLPWSCESFLREGVEDLSAVRIDPERVALVDLNWANNGARLRTDWASWLGFTSRLLRGLQAFFRGGGGW